MKDKSAERAPKGARGARKLALDILYEHEVGGNDLEAGLQRHASNPVYERAGALVRGVAEHRDELDRLISERSRDWPLDRMPPIDRILLRLAIFEILFGKEVSPAIAINEAIEMAKIYSTEDSGRFINGVLGAIVAAKSEGV